MTIESKDILGWCFITASLVFGVFGFLYAVYASAMFATATPPPITRYLRQFCFVLAFILGVLTGLAIFTSYNATVGLSTWLIVLCFVILWIFSIKLVFKMDKTW